MKQFLSAVSIIVADYDEAIDYYTNKLGFELNLLKSVEFRLKS